MRTVEDSKVSGELARAQWLAKYGEAKRKLQMHNIGQQHQGGRKAYLDSNDELMEIHVPAPIVFSMQSQEL